MLYNNVSFHAFGPDKLFVEPSESKHESNYLYEIEEQTDRHLERGVQNTNKSWIYRAFNQLI